jgi:hypothetical protein
MFCCEQVLGVYSFKARQEYLRHLECRNVITGGAGATAPPSKWSRRAFGKVTLSLRRDIPCWGAARHRTPASDDCAFVPTSVFAVGA